MRRAMSSSVITQDELYETSHVVLSYLTKMSYVLPINVSCISMLFTQDELYEWNKSYVP